MKKIAMLFGFLFCGNLVYAQLNTNAQTIFKIFLFLDKQNVNFKGIDSTVSKNDSLYYGFSSVILLKLDTLKIIKNSLKIELTNANYGFYKLVPYDISKSNHSANIGYKRKLNSSEQLLFGIPAGGSDSYIISINRSSGMGYRLKGFNDNDFLSFLSDFKEIYKKKTGRELQKNSFLNSFQVEDLDFECLLDGLTARKIDRIKYTCLSRAAEIFPVH